MSLLRSDFRLRLENRLVRRAAPRDLDEGQRDGGRGRSRLLQDRAAHVGRHQRCRLFFKVIH